MTFWLVVAAIMLLMTDHYVLACIAIYFAFATISHDEPTLKEEPDTKSEIPPEDIDKSG
jgi:hypothetical protein